MASVHAQAQDFRFFLMKNYVPPTTSAGSSTYRNERIQVHSEEDRDPSYTALNESDPDNIDSLYWNGYSEGNNDTNPPVPADISSASKHGPTEQWDHSEALTAWATNHPSNMDAMINWGDDGGGAYDGELARMSQPFVPEAHDVERPLVLTVDAVREYKPGYLRRRPEYNQVSGNPASESPF